MLHQLLGSQDGCGDDTEAGEGVPSSEPAYSSIRYRTERRPSSSQPLLRISSHISGRDPPNEDHGEQQKPQETPTRAAATSTALQITFFAKARRLVTAL